MQPYIYTLKTFNKEALLSGQFCMNKKEIHRLYKNNLDKSEYTYKDTF